MENITDYVNQLCYRHRELLQEDCTNTDEFFQLTSELQSVYGLECDEFGFFTLEQLEKPYVTVCYLERLENDKPITKRWVEKNWLPIWVYSTRLELPQAIDNHKKQLESLEKLREEKVKQMQEFMKDNSLDNRYKDKDPVKKEKTPEEKKRLWAEGMVKWSANIQRKRNPNYYDKFK